MAKHGGSTHMYYVYGLIFTAGLCWLSTRFGESDVVHDLQELYAYDFMVLIFGLICYEMDFQLTAFMVLANAIWVAKILRLFWWGMTPDRRNFVGWPVFGILGIIRKYRFPEKFRDVFGTKEQDRAVFLWLAATIPAGYAIVVLVKWKWADQIEIVPYFVMFLMGISLAKMLSHLLTDQKKLRGELQLLGEKFANLAEQKQLDNAELLRIKRGLTTEEIAFIKNCLDSEVEDREMLMRIAARLKKQDAPANEPDLKKGRLQLIRGKKEEVHPTISNKIERQV